MRTVSVRYFAVIAGGVTALIGAPDSAPVEISGIYPHLAYVNAHGECGTGAVVPWADQLWVVTYGPHQPKGSTDKLYEINAAMDVVVRPESVGGTPANRMIHRESQQLFIGPYIIDAQRRVRVIAPKDMYGRLTGNARHLTDPANKIYCASMEEGFYEVNVHTLAVTELFRDTHLEGGVKAGVPGDHGKGLYSGQGRLVYANNGEKTNEAREHPDIASGGLSEWDGTSDKWHVVRRNQFTEVTGPGGLYGNDNPATDPIWTIGWDHRSLILMVLDGGEWHSYRLPKASHAYDGAHGWNTEWPRIRDIGENDLLMTMHGAFWRFPRTFRPARSAGIVPRSTYLKVIGDFARWGERVVMGCDDTAKNEFLNKRRAKGKLAPPGQSQSNLWFVDPAQLDRLGPPIGRGAVWLDDAVKRDEPSEPFLFAGFDQRMLHLVHDANAPVTFTLEIDRAGNDHWTELRRIEVPAAGYAWTIFPPEETGAWIRIRASRDCARATAFFSMRNADQRGSRPHPSFGGLLRDKVTTASGGLLHARGDARQTLGFAATRLNAGKIEPAAYYEMSRDMRLRRTNEAEALAWMQANVAIPRDTVAVDQASVVYSDEQGRRVRLPRGRADFEVNGPLGVERTMREVCTERDLLNCAGTFYEVPAENAGGIAKIRPVATHNRRIHDFASWSGLLVMSGVAADAPAANRHIVCSDDGQVSVWVGAVDDLWSLGKAVGEGGPWKDTRVKAGQPSDPYLMTGYDRKKLTLSHASPQTVKIRLEVDITGTGKWVKYADFEVPAGRRLEHRFPDGYQAYWMRVSSDTETIATAWLVYD